MGKSVSVVPEVARVVKNHFAISISYEHDLCENLARQHWAF